MKTFKIEVCEYLSRIVEVEAQSIDQAFYTVKELYRKKDIVLDYDDFVDVEYSEYNNQYKIDEKYKLTKELIEYLFHDEKKHFEESDKPENHIFKVIERLDLLLV